MNTTITIKQLELNTTTLKMYALKLTKDDDDAKDLIQDTLIKVCINSNKFKEGTNLKAWVYTIMRNTYITTHQRSAIRKNTFVDKTENTFFLNAREKLFFDNLAVYSFIKEDIETEMKKLKKIYKIPFTMYSDGFKYEEIAFQMNIPIGTVKNRIHIARKILKNSLSVYAN